MTICPMWSKPGSNQRAWPGQNTLVGYVHRASNGGKNDTHFSLGYIIMSFTPSELDVIAR
jgi:hypothetical protein